MCSIHSRALWTQVILLTICWAFAVLTLRMSGIIIKVLYGLFNCAQVSGNHSCYFALLTVHCKIVLSLSLWTWTTVCIIGCVLFRLLFPAQRRGAQVLQGAHFEANGRRGRGRIPVIRCGVRWGDARTNNEGKTLLTNVVTVLWYNCAVCVWDRCGMGVCGRCTVCVCVCAWQVTVYRWQVYCMCVTGASWCGQQCAASRRGEAKGAVCATASARCTCWWQWRLRLRDDGDNRVADRWRMSHCYTSLVSNSPSVSQGQCVTLLLHIGSTSWSVFAMCVMCRFCVPNNYQSKTVQTRAQHTVFIQFLFMTFYVVAFRSCLKPTM